MELLVFLRFGTFLFKEKAICEVTSGRRWMEWFRGLSRRGKNERFAVARRETRKESFTSNCKTRLMERDAFLPCGALFILYFVLGAWYCNVLLYSLYRHLSIVLS